MSTEVQEEEQDFSYEYNWPPEGVPADYNELMAKWGPFIANTVKNFNKVPRNLEDLVQHIWMKLMEPSGRDGRNFLQKFEFSAAGRLPKSMTTEEAIVYLGVTRKQWENTLHRNHADAERWAPTPLNKGSIFSRATRFNTEEIRTLDEIDPFRNRPNVRVRPLITARGFKAYLTTAIKNHFANWCRTRSRKYREQLLSGTAVVTKRADSMTHRIGGEIEDFGCWESNIVAMTLADDEMLSVVREVKVEFDKRGLSMDSLSETEDFKADDGRVLKRATPVAQYGLEILDAIISGDGFEAFDQKSPAAMRRATSRVFNEAFKAQERSLKRQKYEEALLHREPEERLMAAE